MDACRSRAQLGVAQRSKYLNGLPKQAIECPAAHFQRLRGMVVGNASVGFRLSRIAGLVKQRGLSMVLHSFFQLYCRFTMKKLGSH